MKKLIIINGTMGVGKSTVSSELHKILKPSVYLDGDWCWDMNPFIVSEENKAMVIDNITHLLKSFLNNSSFEYIVFCWVIHQEDVFTQILEPLKNYNFELHKISLVCSEKALKDRLSVDVENGIREADVIGRSVERINLYNKIDAIKIDVSDITASDAGRQIYEIVK